MSIESLVSHVDFSNFDFSIGMHWATLSISEPRENGGSAAFHSRKRRGPRNSSAHTDSCLIPYLPLSSLNTATIHDSRILGEVEGRTGRKSRRLKRVLPEWGNISPTRKYDLRNNWHVSQIASEKFAIVEIDLTHTTIASKFRNANKWL